jgi:hypothetical protein
MPEKKRPVQFLYENRAVLQSFGEINDQRGGDGTLFPLFPERHLDLCAKILHIVRVGGNEEQELVVIVFMGCLREHIWGCQNIREGKIAPGPLDFFPKIPHRSDIWAGTRRELDIYDMMVLVYPVSNDSSRKLVTAGAKAGRLAYFY